MQNTKCLSFFFFQCPVPAWPDFAPGQPPAPASHPSMALGAAHTPTSCSVAGHSHTAQRTSVGAHTLMSLWRASPTITSIRASQSPLKWRARARSALNPMHLTQIIPHYRILHTVFTYLCPLHPTMPFHLHYSFYILIYMWASVSFPSIPGFLVSPCNHSPPPQPINYSLKSLPISLPMCFPIPVDVPIPVQCIDVYFPLFSSHSLSPAPWSGTRDLAAGFPVL